MASGAPQQRRNRVRTPCRDARGANSAALAAGAVRLADLLGDRVADLLGSADGEAAGRRRSRLRRSQRWENFPVFSKVGSLGDTAR
jgi:hypothetical protein